MGLLSACALYTSFLPYSRMPKPRKPLALIPGSTIAVVEPASSAKEDRIQRGCETLESLDYRVERFSSSRNPDGYFSAPLAERRKQLLEALRRPDIRAILCARGGYGSAEILDALKPESLKQPKIFCAFSDLTSVHIFLWQKLRWVTFYGPLVAGGFDAGANATNGFDPDTFMWAMTATNSGWTVPLEGETFTRGRAEGTLLGGCITLVETSMGTPWELDTRGAILLLEDRRLETLPTRPHAAAFEAGRKIRRRARHYPRRISRMRNRRRGVPLPWATFAGAFWVRLRIPIVYGAPVGHTTRPMLTVPLGVRAQMHASGEGRLEILEPAVRA